MQQKTIVSSFNLCFTKVVAGFPNIKRFNGPSSGCVRCISTSHPCVQINLFFFHARHATIIWYRDIFNASFQSVSVTTAGQSFWKQNFYGSGHESQSSWRCCSPWLKMTPITLDVSGTVAGLISFVVALPFVRLSTWDLQQALVFFFQWSLRGLTPAGKKQVWTTEVTILISPQLRDGNHPTTRWS